MHKPASVTMSLCLLAGRSMLSPQLARLSPSWTVVVVISAAAVKLPDSHEHSLEAAAKASGQTISVSSARQWSQSTKLSKIVAQLRAKTIGTRSGHEEEIAGNKSEGQIDRWLCIDLPAVSLYPIVDRLDFLTSSKTVQPGGCFEFYGPDNGRQSRGVA